MTVPSASRFAFVEGVDARGLSRVQAEGKSVDVRGHALAGQCLGEDDVAAVDGPAQGDLGGADAQFVADGAQGGVGDGTSASQGRPCFEDHAEALGVGAQVGVGEEGVCLDL